jgi:ATP-dependent Clp protease ATP-binding subunit ClpA
LHYSESAAGYLAQQGYSIKYGARFLKRKIDEMVKIPITLKWRETEHFSLEFEGEKLVVN